MGGGAVKLDTRDRVLIRAAIRFASKRIYLRRASARRTAYTELMHNALS
jgi:hypothetical protein